MGDWALVILGTGQHHNNGAENDADVVAQETIRRLLDAGQSLRHAEFVSGSSLLLPTRWTQADQTDA